MLEYLAHIGMWTVYRHPVDHPDEYVARKWLIGIGPEPVPTQVMFTAETLEELRDLLPPGMICLYRDQNDDPCIVETWI